MKLGPLRRPLRKLLPDVDERLKAFRREHPKSDIDTFLAHLHSSGVIDQAAFGELHAIADCAVDRSVVFRKEAPTRTLRVSRLDLVNDKLGRLLVRQQLVDARKVTKLLDQLKAHNAKEPDNPKMLARVLLKRELIGREQVDAATEELGGLPACVWCGGPPPVVDSTLERLGRVAAGSMGEIHVARDGKLGRKVAYKTLLPSVARDDRACQAFLDEAQITAQLDHPAIVPVYALEAGAGPLAYTMKLVRGTTLRDWVKTIDALHQKQQPLGEEHQLPARLERFLKICDAVYYAHVKRVLHRDLKPSNVMIGPHGEVYVMDWGIARIIGDRLQMAATAEVDAASLDATGSATVPHLRGKEIAGTPAYMSPEQCNGDPDDLDGRSDQYALGAILHNLLTLRRAIPGADARAVLEHARRGVRAPVVHAYGDPVPTELVAIVDKAMAMEPAGRYATVKELAEDVRRYLADEPVLARPDTPRQAALRWVGRNRATMAMGLLLALLLFSLATIWATTSTREALRAKLGEQKALADAQAEREQAAAKAAARQATVARFVAKVGRRSQHIDARLLRYEGLLVTLASTARAALLHGEPSDMERLFYNDDFGSPERRPSDTEFSRRYKKAISLSYPVAKRAPGVAAKDVQQLLRKLGPLRRIMPSLLLQSERADWETLPEAERRALIRDRGVPLVWAYVGLERGVHYSYPGKTGYPEAYDPRKRPWYRGTVETFGPKWGTPYVDVSGQGMILPCTAAIRDVGGELLGVAGVELTLDFVVEKLLALPGVIETFLVNPQGAVLVRSSEAGQTFEGGNLHGNQTKRLEAFGFDNVVESIKAGQPGGVETAGGRLIVYTRLRSVGWYYAVVVDEVTLLAGGD